MKRRRSLNTTWYGLIILITIIPMIILFSWFGYREYSLLLKDAILVEKQFNEKVRTNISVEFNRIITLLQNKGDPMAFTINRTLNKEMIETLFEAVFSRERAINSLSLLSRKKDVHLNMDRDGVLNSVESINRHQDKEDKLLDYEHLINTEPLEFVIPLHGRTYVSSPIIKENSAYFRIGVPVGPVNNPVAVLVASVNTEELWKEVLPIFSRTDVDAYLVDSRGSLLAIPSNSDLHIGKLLTNMKIVRALISNKEWDSAESYIGLFGKHVLGDTSYIDTLNWGVISEIPRNKITGPIYTTISIVAGIILLIILITGGIGLLLVNRLLSPFALLSNAFDRVSKGDYTTRMDSSSVKEIDSIVDGFNRMTQVIKQRDSEIRNSETKLQAIIDNTTAVIYMKDPQGKYLLINHQYEKLFHVSKTEIIGKTDYEIFPKDKADVFRKNDRKVIDSERPMQFEELVPHDDGLHTYISLKFPLLNAENIVYGVCGTSTDITVHKQNEEELKEHKVLLERAQQLALIGHWTLIPETGVVTGSEELFRIFNLSCGDMTLDSFVEVVHPDDREMDTAAIQRAVEHGESWDIEHRLICRDGKVKWVHAIGEAVTDEAGNVVELVGTVQDISAHKKAEEALHKAQDSITGFAHILEESLNEIYIFDARNLQFIQVNKGARMNLGYSMKELSRLTPLDLKPKPTLETFKRRLEPLRSGREEKINFITVHQRKDGSLYDVEIHLQLSTFQSNPVFIAIVLDITERKKSEKRISENAAMLTKANKELTLQSEIIKNMIEGVYIVSMVDARIIYANPKFEQMFGYSAGEMNGKHASIVNAQTENDPKVTAREIMTMLSKTGEWHGEVNNVKKDGTAFWCYANVSVFSHLEYGEVCVSVHTDITERKQAERELKQLNETLEDRVIERTAEIAKFSHAIEHSSATIVITDVEGNIEYVNPWFTKTTGYTSKEAIGENPRILKSGDQTPEFYRELWEAILSGNEWKGEFYNKTKAGQLYWEFASISPIKNKDGIITNFVAVKENITERKMAEAKLKAASEKALRATEAKSAFLSSMSHELRTPMNSILGFAQLLMTNQKEPLAESQKERVQHILDAGDHLLELINEVLDLSSIESGKLPISPDIVNVGVVIDEAITAVVPMAQQFNIKINNKTNRCDHYIVAHRTRVKQVVANLLTNAIKYNHTGGSVTISCESPNTYTLRINVEDTGLGISENDFDTLFEPFNRLGRESLNIEGTGVGLTITKALVEYMGGSIGIESKEGKGSKFFVTFNKAKAPVSEVTETKELPDEKHLEPMRERKTLLYVEDDNANLTLVKNILRRRPNIKLLTALDAESGIELVLEQHPDLILMDINLPQMDGYEALKKLKSNDATKRIPAIAISADAMPDSIKKGKNAGFLEYITKPLNVNNFLDVIDNIFKEERK